MPIESYIVTINRPRDYTPAALASYIQTAVARWGGGFHPNDGMFGVEQKDVIVKRVKEGISS